MTIQTTTNRSTIKTRSSAKREHQYKITKYASIGKGPRTVTVDPVSKQLTYEARKTPACEAKANSRYASTPIGSSGSSLSRGQSQRSKPRASLLSHHQVSTMSFASPSKGKTTSAKKSSQVKRREILSPLASFSPNLRTPSRSLRTPYSKTKRSLSSHGVRIPILPTIPSPTLRIPTPTVRTPLAEIRHDPLEEAPLKDAYPCGFCEIDFNNDEIFSNGDTPMKEYVSFVTGYEDGAFSLAMTKGASQYVPIIFSPSQDKSEGNPFHQTPAKTTYLVDQVSMDTSKIMDIEEIDAELGEFHLFDYRDYRLTF